MARVRLYTTASCPYCVAAKRLLASLGAEVEEVRLDDQPELWARLERELRFQTVPMVFVDDVFVGGYDDLAAMHRRGELAARLSPAPGASPTGAAEAQGGAVSSSG